MPQYPAICALPHERLLKGEHISRKGFDIAVKLRRAFAALDGKLPIPADAAELEASQRLDAAASRIIVGGFGEGAWHDLAGYLRGTFSAWGMNRERRLKGEPIRNESRELARIGGYLMHLTTRDL